MKLRSITSMELLMTYTHFFYSIYQTGLQLMDQFFLSFFQAKYNKDGWKFEKKRAES